ncbi:MAG: aspartate-alanine antiporter [Candidatus Omnitrophota bacterium]
MHAVIDTCRTYPQIVIFLALALGYAAGKIKFFGFSLGSTTCVLLSALALGQIGVDVPDILKNVSFALFTFCIGYKVGPQFFGALKKEGLNYIWISLLVAFIGLGSAIFLGKMLHFDKGTTAGFFAGSMTQSAALGTAEGAIAHLSISDAQKSVLDTNVAVAYAITYIFGTAGIIVFIKMIPRLFKIDLKEEARKLEVQMSGGSAGGEKPELFSWAKQLDLRVYRLTNQSVVGKTIAELEALFPGRVAVDALKRADKLVDVTPDTVIQSGDMIAVIGRRTMFVKANEIVGPEIDDASMSEIIGEILEICVLNSAIAGKKLGEIALGKETHGIFLRKITRQGHELPITRDTVINKCDVFQVIGAKSDVERIVKLLGYPERPTAVTDLVMVGLGCVLGTLIGLVAVPIAGIPLTLGVGGGVLVAGLLFGWLRAVHPTFGQIPSGGQWVLQDLGLNLFIACVGLTAGTKAVQAFQTTGLSVFLAGALLSLLPVIAGLAFGKFVLKMNPVILLGAVAGARVLTAALNMLQEECESTMPVLGYAAPYAFGNVLLTIWGSVIINVM